MTGWFERVAGGPRLGMPLLVRLSGAFAGLWAACALLVLALMIGVALFGGGPFEFNGEPVSRASYLRHLPPVALGLGALATYFGAVAFGIWRERAWVRPAVLAFWLGISALLVGQGIAGVMNVAVALIWPAIYLGFVGWYFYRKPNVVDYYRALEARARPAANGEGVDQRAPV